MDLSNGGSVMEAIGRAVARLMNRVRVNSLRRAVEDGILVYIKRRRPAAGVVIWFANWFLSLARSGCCMFVNVQAWQDWEVYSARLLYPDRPAVRKGPGRAVTTAVAPGMSLRELLARGQADAGTFAAAAREVRRVHAIHCSAYNAAWSHGDLHLDNIIFDSDSGRVVLIDFDTRHLLTGSAEDRHADDLKVMILELIGRPGQGWEACADSLICSYGDARVIKALAEQLVVPGRGFARILWYTRTGGIRIAEASKRLEVVRRRAMDFAESRQGSRGTTGT